MPDETILDDKIHWYKDAVIYELHIKAFADGNGDGIGDFEGLLQKLDYLQDLGVTAIWLLPFYPSPLRDDGYDIADYYTINPSYGNIKEFKQLLKEAHERGLKVITELVINHTSDQHPWFQRARTAPIGSDHRNYYVWTDDTKQYEDARIIFQDFEASNWTWDPVAKQYYWHRFFSHQPDLNYDNPSVQNEVFKILDYWCKLGVDGFRLDAVPYLFERDGTNCENLPETHDYLKKLRKYVDDHFPGTLLLAEANMWPEDAAAYFGDGDECQMNYHFPVMPRMFMAVQMEDRYPLTDIFEQTPAIPENCQWAIFLRNHDELTLEMVTDEERDYMYKSYVKNPKARINLGIRHRLAPLLENNRNKIELLNSLLFTLPGTPVLYYGDEIGLGDNFYLGDRDGVRTPMQWNADRNAGFSQANPQRLYLPLILDPQYHFEAVNVELQSKNTSSLLWWTKRMIAMRKKYKAFGRGDLSFIPTENAKVLVYTRTYQDQVMLVVANLSRYPQAAQLDLDAFTGFVPVEVMSKNRFPQVKPDLPYLFTLGAHACQCFELVKEVSGTLEIVELPTFSLKEWKSLPLKEALETLENKILPNYLKQVCWFDSETKRVDNIKITDVAEVPTQETSVYFLLIEVAYHDGFPEKFQLPVAFGGQPFSAKIRETCPDAIIAKLLLNGEEGILYDAIYGTELQMAVLELAANHHTVHLHKSELFFKGSKSLKNHLNETEKIKPRVLSAPQLNTLVIYDQVFCVKIFRKLDYVINSDLEIIRFLTSHTNFRNTPALEGSIEWKFENGNMVLGMIQEVVQSNSDGWTYMLDRINDFNERVIALPDMPPLITALQGTLTTALPYNEMPAYLLELLDNMVANRVQTLGQRTGELHLALASDKDLPDFAPEEYSLHYQRSLYSGLQALVRTAFSLLTTKLNGLPETEKTLAKEVLENKQEILQLFKTIYGKTIEVDKIRVHGDYNLEQVLFTGKDFFIIDFEGNPESRFSERRIKRSAIRDVASMIRSFSYVMYRSLYADNQIREEDIIKLLPFAEQWYHYVSGFFVKAYLDTVKDAGFVPKDREGFNTLLQVFLMEKALNELIYELNHRPDWAIIPLKGIIYLLKSNKQFV
ncbi:maltose alpha-D-glucosyltransferase [Mucilaginibacter sp.]|uniref:maltose alpha-D-glucosyltransferase n=1 Tax=Mucilaginibacter sp. TaxID=1882438 RepID=UPI003AFFE573